MDKSFLFFLYHIFNVEKCKKPIKIKNICFYEVPILFLCCKKYIDHRTHTLFSQLFFVLKILLINNFLFTLSKKIPAKIPKKIKRLVGFKYSNRLEHLSFVRIFHALYDTCPALLSSLFFPEITSYHQHLSSRKLSLISTHNACVPSCTTTCVNFFDDFVTHVLPTYKYIWIENYQQKKNTNKILHGCADEYLKIFDYHRLPIWAVRNANKWMQMWSKIYAFDVNNFKPYVPHGYWKNS